MTELLDHLRDRLGGIYRIDRELGGGGMSRVFVAEEIALGRAIVLKVLPPELRPVLSPARFEREVRVAARLQHPHIVPLLAAGHVDDVLYYTMPLVEGESLRARLDRQYELPVTEATRLLRNVADALAHAHREGVVHRDIKPDNILLSHGYAMVTDFGVARALDQAANDATVTRSGVAVGTPAYMAPEQAAADAAVDHRADLYALGVVGYEMLAGQAPFHGSTFQALVAAHFTQTPPPLRETRQSVPAELAAIVHCLLEKRPADRYQTAEELVAALDRVANGRTSSGPVLAAASPTLSPATAESTGSAPPGSGVSRRAVVIGGAVALAGAFGSGMLVGRRGTAKNNPEFHRLTFRRGMIRTARFGPDFRTVIYGALWDGDVCRAYAVRPESPESAPLALPPAAPLAVSASGELALSMGTHLRGIMPYGTLARVPLAGGAPREMQERVRYADWSPDGGALAVVRAVGERDQLEFPLGTILAVPDSAMGGFSFPRVSPAGDAVAVFELDVREYLLGRVVVIDRSGVKRTQSAHYFNVFGLAWRGDAVWFTAADTRPLFRNAVYAMNASGDARIVARVPGNTSLHDIAPDGRALIARTDDRSGVAVRVPGEPADRDLSWLDATMLADISPDGQKILLTETGVGGGARESTYLRNTDGSAAVRLGDGRAHALSPDGRWAIVRSEAESRGFDVIPTGAGAPFRMERPGLTLLDVRWLPDRPQVVASARAGDGPARLYLVDVEGSAVRPVTPPDLAIGSGGWALAPAGDMVAVSTGQQIELFPVAGGASRGVPGDTGAWSVVGWIENGILVSRRPEVGGPVLSVDPVTGRRAPWADIQPQDPAGIMSLDLGTLVVTPDGRGYGYSWHRAISDLYLVEGWS